jgi:dihydroorotase
MKKLLIKNGHLIDPSQSIDAPADILVSEGVVQEVRIHEEGERENIPDDCVVYDVEGMYVIPGVVDMHVHLRDPGFEYKETIRTGTASAVRGGVTSVCCMPNTYPINDNETVTRYILQKAILEGSCDVYPIGAITKGQKGEELAEMGLMYEAGCVAFSDDGRPVMNSLLMRRALEYSKRFGVPIISHAEDINLSANGMMNEGGVSLRLGLRGIPAESEIIMIKRDIELAALTGGRLHIAHVSTEGGVKALREAKRAGIPVTAETCPHYFLLTEEAVEGYNTNAKVNPPLRTRRDLEAIREALADGTIDIIASDHAPHHKDEKLCEFEIAASGISGLETLLLLSLQLYHKGILSLSELIRKLTQNPATILGLSKGTLRKGAQADIVVLDLETDNTIKADEFVSKGKNTPFDGMRLKGRVVETFWKGTPMLKGITPITG